jgi:hypothetical protein
MKGSRWLALVGVLIVLPYFLPRKSRVLRRTLVRAKPHDIFPLVNDLKNWPQWTAWNRKEKIDYAYDGISAGPGAVQKWRSSRQHGTLHIVQSVENERVTYDLDMGPFHIEGLLAIEPLGLFSRVSWLCKWNTGANPYLRYRDLIGRFMIGRDFDTGLANLKQLGECGSAN